MSSIGLERVWRLYYGFNDPYPFFSIFCFKKAKRVSIITLFPKPGIARSLKQTNKIAYMSQIDCHKKRAVTTPAGRTQKMFEFVFKHVIISTPFIR